MNRMKAGRLYRVAALCAVLSFLFGIFAFNIQNSYVEARFAETEQVDQFVSEMMAEYSSNLLPFYDLTALYGVGILFPFLAVFAAVCLLPGDRQKTRKLTCLVLGVGFLSYAVIAMLFKIITAAITLYQQVGSPGEEELRTAILGMAEHNFFEMIFIALFALSLIVTGLSQKYRPIAVSFGAVCIYRLVSVNLWLLTIPFEAVEGVNIKICLHGILLFLTFATAFASAVLVSMSRPTESLEEVAK